MQQANLPTPIPPPELRLGIGPFEDSKVFLESGQSTLKLAVEVASLDPSHSILDVGCGCGRLALPLMDFLSEAGSYTGFDPSRECIEWCNENIAASDSRFDFIHIDFASDSYNPRGTLSPSTYSFLANSQYDFAILSSVITHLYPDEIENYIRNLAQVLTAGGRALISALIMDEEAHQAVKSESTIFDFRYRVGESCWTFDPNRPLDGIACEKHWLLDTLVQFGLEVISIHEGNWRRVKSYDIQHDWLSIRRAA